MEQAWRGILARYGQPVELVRGETRQAVRAMVQPVLEQGGEQREPSPLGAGEQERWLYMGPADAPVELDTVVCWGGRGFRVRRTALAGTEICPYRWAVLRPREEAEM